MKKVVIKGPIPVQSRFTRRVVVQVSGGLDSAVVLWLALSAGQEVFPVTFLYGQRHAHQEIKAAGALIRAAKDRFGADSIPWEGTIDLDMKSISSELIKRPEIPVDGLDYSKVSFHVPGRNALFMSWCFSFAESVAAEAVYTGCNGEDAGCHPDASVPFFRGLETAFNDGRTGQYISIEQPLADCNKVGVLYRAIALGVPHELTYTCFLGGEKPCNECKTCKTRNHAYSRVFDVRPQQPT